MSSWGCITSLEFVYFAADRLLAADRLFRCEIVVRVLGTATNCASSLAPLHIYAVPIPMQCPFCMQTLASHRWTKGQWRARAPIANKRVGCRACHGRGPDQALLDEYTWRLDLLTFDIEDWSEGQEEFLMEWRERGEFEQTKELSRRGFLRCLHVHDPKHWQDLSSGTWYFDPGNKIYKMTVQRACPSFLRRTRMSNEIAIGDAIEALLGLVHELYSDGSEQALAYLHTPWPSSNVSPAWAARFWRIITYHMHRANFIHEWRLSCGVAFPVTPLGPAS